MIVAALAAAPACSHAADRMALVNLQTADAKVICEIAGSAGFGAAEELKRNAPLPAGTRLAVISSESKLNDEEDRTNQ